MCIENNTHEIQKIDEIIVNLKTIYLAILLRVYFFRAKTFFKITKINIELTTATIKLTLSMLLKSINNTCTAFIPGKKTL